MAFLQKNILQTLLGIGRLLVEYALEFWLGRHTFIIWLYTYTVCGTSFNGMVTSSLDGPIKSLWLLTIIKDAVEKNEKEKNQEEDEVNEVKKMLMKGKFWWFEEASTRFKRMRSHDCERAIFKQYVFLIKKFRKFSWTVEAVVMY